MKNSLRFAILLSGAGLAACGAPATRAPEVGNYAPPFALTTSDDTTLALVDMLAGGPVLLYFNMAYG